MTDCEVRDNTTYGRGGGIRINVASDVSVRSTVVEGNSGFSGGVSQIYATDLVLDDLVIRDNVGGAVEMWGGDGVTLSGSVLSDAQHGLFLNANVGSNITGLRVEGNEFSGPSAGAGTVAIAEGQADISGHALLTNATRGP